ncbi:MAG: hypothetical protein GF375_00915 [Candidatus Omnitrophica bacterium]|nr:hypothetical protein [Candidatus Omnitrophota bacterium]
MAYNIYKQLPKFRDYLLENNIKISNIPRSDFGRQLMLFFGMNKKTAIKWIDQFIEVGLIIEEDNNINFNDRW